MKRLVPGSEPFLLPAGRIGCILIHGFTAMPEETRSLGEFLFEQGITVLGLRLSGHASHPSDLAPTHWTDWLLDVECGLALISQFTDQVFLIGQSMGGILSLIASTEQKVAGVAVLSTPALPVSQHLPFGYFFQRIFFPIVRKESFAASRSSGGRREVDYPAYPWYPSRIHTEVHHLQRRLDQILPSVSVPLLIIQAKDDPWVPVKSAEHLYATAQSTQKSILWFEQAGHAILQCEQKDLAHRAVLTFIQDNSVDES